MGQRSTDYFEAVTLIDRMPAEDRAQLQVYLASFGSGRRPTAEVATINADGVSIVFTQLLRFMVGQGVSSERVTVPAVERLMRSKAGKAAEVQAAAVWEFVATHISGRVDREAALQIGFKCLYDYLATWMTDGFGTDDMLRNLDKFATAIDSNFPGYAGSGLLSMIIRAA